MSDLKNTNPALYELARRNGATVGTNTGSAAPANRGPLTLSELQQSYPGLYAECVAQGIQRERERILAALPAPSGNARERFARECIRNGSPMTETVKANYLTLTMEAARKDNASAQVVAAIEKRLGVGYES